MGILVNTLCVLICASTTLRSQERLGQNAHEFDGTVTYQSKIKYLLFFPKTYGQRKEEKWPLIMYLHGGSLRGEDAERIRASGYGIPGLVERDPSFPFVVLSPLSPTGEYWKDSEAPIALLDKIEKEYAVDPDRVYLTGHILDAYNNQDLYAWFLKHHRSQ